MEFTELRDALAAGPVASPWNAAEYTDHDGPPACDDIAVQAPARPHELETLLTMDWSEATPRVAGLTREQATVTARFIAVASPEVVASLLAERDTMRSLLAEWDDGMYDGKEFLRRVRLVLHGGNGLQAVPVGPNV